MPILIMGLVALLLFVTIVVLICSAGMAERHEREETGAEPQAPNHAPKRDTKAAA